MKKENREDVENKINFIAQTTLGGLKGVFVENKLSDREATFGLMYFMEVLVRLGWKDCNPTDVLKNLIQILEDKE